MPRLAELKDLWGCHLAGSLSRPVLLGIACFAVIIAVLAAVGVASTARGDYVVSADASSSSAAMETTEHGESAATPSSGTEAASSSAGTQSTRCFVHVVGAVKKPGVYELASGARVDDAVKAAGGLTKSADARSVNLARQVADGEQIVVPAQGERADQASPAPGSQDAAKQEASVSGAATAADGKVNINTATEQELVALPGIGEATASKIVASRESAGPFSSPEDIMRVSGIGAKKYEAIADLVAV